MQRFLLAASLAPLLLRSCSAALHENLASLDALNKSFDFIVVGGGTSGNVLANRLSEKSGFNVLVLEAGGSNEGISDITVPLLCVTASPFTAQDWNYTSVAQTHMNDRVISYPRGFVLGGSSSINYMAWTRGATEDWNRLASIADDQRWSWNSLLPYFRKNEKFTTPSDGHDTTGQYDPSLHSTTGRTSVTLGVPVEIDSKVIGMTSDPEFPFNLDMNSGSEIGLGYTQMSINDGARSSSATAYLSSDALSRPNLHVLLHARVTRILPTTTNSFRTVEFRDAQGNTIALTASKEVILSAGSVGTPSILMHSGIGDAAALTALGITPLKNLPSVGKNLSDHPLLPLEWPVNSDGGTFDPIFQNSGQFTSALGTWNSNRTGRMSSTPISHIGFFRAPNTTFAAPDTPDPAAGPTTPHFEFLIINGFVGYRAGPPTGTYLTLGIAVVSPASRGSITLGSSDPLAPPLIDPNFFAQDVDVAMMRAGVRSAFRFVGGAAFAGYIADSTVVDGLGNASTDAEVDAFIRGNTGTVFHPVGTAAMSPVNATWGVVDPDCKVKGVHGLRVVDLSVMTRVVAGHPQAAAYVIAERVSDMIKAVWT
ncbi:phosphoribosylaminoimidazole carboxylase [Mycena kentingensis (nom. inval.)]|nr:phosphoribosylaminoimidazole carboxylase [Mycena kentingensis (nom. inval.)]